MTSAIAQELHSAPVRLPKELVANSAFLMARLGFGFKALAVRELEQAGFSLYHYGALALLGEGTRLTQRDQIEWKIPKLQQPIARRMVSRDIGNQFSALKRVLEGPE